MKKKNLVIVVLSIVVVLVVAGLYGTFATSSTVSNDDTTYNITLTGSTEEVVVPAYSSKTIIYHITNTNEGKVQYGVTYSGSNITVRIYLDSADQASGLIDYGENKFIKLYVSNNGSTESTATIKTVLGYEYGGDLIIPPGDTLVTGLIGNTSKYIIDLYTEATKTTVANNSITYNYANIYDVDDDSNTSGGLMNDRLGGTTSSLDGGNIRYYGANPNNYIYFNCSDYANQSADTCELWRIIGVFDDKVKIIRNDSIGTFSWDNKNTSTGAEEDNGKNDWTTARLMKLLNPSDYYTVDANDNGLGQSLYYTGQSGTCYRGFNNATTSCDFTSTGLKNDTTRNMIEEVTWNLGGWNGKNSNSVYSNQFYSYERSTTVYSGRPTSWTGKIALMYPSDYGYATDFTKCSQNLYNYNSSTDSYACRTNDWLYNSVYLWLLTPHSSNTVNAWIVVSSGYIGLGTSVYSAYRVRPVLYLNSKVIIESGNGTSSSPYRLSVS